MKNILSILFICSLMVACSDDDNLILDEFIPDEDAANNFCVYSHSYTGGCRNAEGLSSGDGDSIESIESYLQWAVDRVQDGSDGYFNEIIDTGYKYWDECGNYTRREFGKYAYWVSYKCDSIAVDIKSYGPFHTSEASDEINKISDELAAEGYNVGYVDQEYATDSIIYLIFYVYKEDPTNAKQAQVIQGLELLKAKSKLKSYILGKKRETLLEATINSKDLAFTESQKRSVDKAITFLKSIKKIKRK